MFRLSRLITESSAYALTFSAKIGYVSTVLNLCIDSLGRYRVYFAFVLDLKLFLHRGISVDKLHLLDFQSRNLNRANRGWKCLLHFAHDTPCNTEKCNCMFKRIENLKQCCTLRRLIYKSV